MDRAWWKEYVADVRSRFQGFLLCPIPNCCGVPQESFRHGLNSGYGAISLAAHLGAERIIMLGYDCQHTGGMAHWHGDHPSSLGNAGSVGEWPAQFKRLSQRLRKIEVINCSRETALHCFPRMDLESALCKSSAS